MGEDSNATGVNGNQADNSAPNVGAAYVFTGLGPPPTPTPSPAALGNISTRLDVGQATMCLPPRPFKQPLPLGDQLCATGMAESVAACARCRRG